jgi:hypothetical protein
MLEKEDGENGIDIILGLLFTQNIATYLGMRERPFTSEEELG